MKTILIIGAVIPEPQSTAAGTRMMQLIEHFRSGNYRIYFASPALQTDFSINPEDFDINFISIKINNSETIEIFKKIHPDIIIYDRFIIEEQFGWQIDEACPNALKVLDTEDLHFLRKAREKAFMENSDIKKCDFISDVFKREIASILRCDLSLIISDFEIDLLRKDFKINESILLHLPMYGEKKTGKNTFANRKNFISIGNFLHEPNLQTVLRLKKVWPKIKMQIPEAELHIFGAYLPQKVRQLHNEKEKFLIKGRAGNLQTLYENYRVMLAPIPFGAGIKGKLIESMQFGIPNVTTEIGAEGMRENMEWNGFICNSEQEFIQKAAELYSDEGIWKKSQQNGYLILETKFSKSDFEKKFSKRIKELLSNLTLHRNANFLGIVLRHHSLQSTKYLSKWIEEKTKS